MPVQYFEELIKHGTNRFNQGSTLTDKVVKHQIKTHKVN